MVQAEPKGWSEAMVLEEHDPEDSISPSLGEVGHHVAVEVLTSWAVSGV